MEPEKCISSATMDPSIQPPGDGTSKPALEDESLEQIDEKNSNHDEEAGPEQDATEKAPLDVSQPKKKKKKNRKPKSKRGQDKPTGFEEYYVDAPMTPDEHDYEREIYQRERPVIFRIQEALTRYQAKRRIETERMQVFSRYLIYGGVEVGPKMFGGLSAAELKQMDSENIATARSQTNIRYDRLDMKVDFDAVVRGFLEETIKLATVTIKNFLNYLLYHDVCPEYKDNINAARASCDIATKQLWDNQRFVAQGPGHFNQACSMLFGGYFFDPDADGSDWVNEKSQSPRMTSEIARKVIKFALAGAGSDEQATRFRDLSSKNELRAVCIEDIDGFEVTEAILPDNDLREFYRTQAPDLRPVGKLRAKPYRDPARPKIDLSPEESVEWEQKWNDLLHSTEFEFLVEEDLLRFCYPGMKVTTTVWRLNCGLDFFDEVFSAYCSIYTILANDLMIGWKKPRDKTVKDAEEEEKETTGEDKGKKKAEGGEMDGSKVEKEEEDDDDD
ncbi:hypothetical protein T310_4491 [Rasamsonia emersonii CBS 393.64]|uniref:Argonaute complex, subunit Arb1 n=1 Tax=Rasamsonia emersonii (strain ATCC 16479 / CBS 393.64 / IMI 116815) TaxID=1408163 RepID=A0A0F4YUC2_RASE3|nr:hypothetical protein T310_4491 [Rasamsonia emersonii CBS 393.64]KKA21456.1 hypothetical protein T310_4491 [Rasamsonia emersonii CBS 393.64]